MQHGSNSIQTLFLQANKQIKNFAEEFAERPYLAEVGIGDVTLNTSVSLISNAIWSN